MSKTTCIVSIEDSLPQYTPHWVSDSASQGWSAEEPEAYAVVRGPVRLALYHRFQGLETECVAAAVRGNRHAPAVSMGVTLMRPDLADEIKTVAIEGGDQIPGGERSEAPDNRKP